MMGLQVPQPPRIIFSPAVTLPAKLVITCAYCRAEYVNTAPAHCSCCGALLLVGTKAVVSV